MPQFMKPKPVAPKPVAKNSAQSCSEQQQPKNPANTAQAPKTGAKGKINSGGVKLASRKKTWTAPVKDQAVVADNKQLAAGAATDHKICDDCKMDYPGDCPVHGPLTQVKDTPVPLGDPQRANKTVPEGLSVRRSTVKGAQYGVFTLKRLPKRLCFGPYEGVKVDSSAANGYTWQVRIRQNGRAFLVDGRPLDRSNWMRYVNCAPERSQQNLAAFVRQGAVYYRTCKVVNAAEELFVWYGDDFAKQLGLIGNVGAQDQAAEVDGTAAPEVFFLHNVGRHEMTHTGERPFVCPVCDRGFNRRGNLGGHLRVHTKERPYECRECGQRFSDASNMATHRRVQHSGDSARRHACPECGKRFTQRFDLKRHLVTHTGEKPHACSECGKRFALRYVAKRHEQVVHGRHYPLHCPHCGKGLQNITKLRSHVRARHNDECEDDQ
ncbi:histone-lysine N-methyltransferase PRDM9-like [Dermacentor silvarum]|uniref:histone-lysine N-methyltransferase PRDM9-like n=1 Tax=Dermacentor silvarum TaxID=543639 RepID=UPI002100BA89|nr:histone-lysine N-methyltransferase PRDM9-like [Dermacentor silvarum]